MEKCRIPHEDYLFIFNERVNACASGTAECHRREVVHQAGERFVFEHRIAADIAVKNQIYRGRIMLFFHVIGIHELLRDLEEDAGRITMRAAGTERRSALRDVKLLFGYLLLQCLFPLENVRIRTKFFVLARSLRRVVFARTCLATCSIIDVVNAYVLGATFFLSPSIFTHPCSNQSCAIPLRREMLEKRCKPLDEDRRIQSRFRRQPVQPLGELLPPHLHVPR